MIEENHFHKAQVERTCNRPSFTSRLPFLILLSLSHPRSSTCVQFYYLKKKQYDVEKNKKQVNYGEKKERKRNKQQNELRTDVFFVTSKIREWTIHK